jgi:acyl-CoA oxidase
LETTATYDIQTDEFVIESPTITSPKVWIGMAGQSATHAVVISQTVVMGKNKGLNWFVVQLRDPVTGQLMPNVMAGDMGSKVGK